MTIDVGLTRTEPRTARAIAGGRAAVTGAKRVTTVLATPDLPVAEEVRCHKPDPPRETLNVYGASDYAVTSDGGHYVHVVVGVDPENRMHLLDLWRGQTSSDVWVEAWQFVGRGDKAVRAQSIRGRMAMLGLYV